MKLDPGKTPSAQLERQYSAGPTAPVSPLTLVAADPATFANIWQHLVDQLTEQIALLDDNWTILVVNQSWTKVAELYGHSALGPGTNYLQFCRKMAADGLAVAVDVVAGLEDITEGKRNSFQLVYQASEPEVDYDHQLTVNRFEVAGRKFASITRYDVTRYIELGRLRKTFSQSVMLGQADERRRIAREIHDSTMQLLVCLNLNIGHLRRDPRLEGESILEEMGRLVSEAQQEIQAISFLAHPPLLGKLSLTEALPELVEGFGRRTGLDVSFETVGEAPLKWVAAEEAAYRIVQEALSNLHRHSQARRAIVRLVVRDTITHVVIADDGVGMPNEMRSGVGLAGMRSRLLELGGRLSIRSLSPGTALIASIPTADRDKLHF